ncbi:MAG TPA: calcium-binding protein [Mesorhizobium sp.]|uniref:calcium-binding protein n=1 Tax=Mesorhizobium sp. TaxID=1871066 RepID=UPI002DDD945C|nr:calcium-binding protein [Mesorhizobium sp.]HEV2504856.1 calcium-binding protein [Mesorhizobium sp.]
MGTSNSSRSHQPGCGNNPPQTVQVRTVTAQSAIGVSAQVSADAFGQATFSNTQVHLTTIDRGLASFAIAAVGVQAAAQAAGDQTPFAMASAVVTMSNADISVTNSRTVTGTDAHAMSQQTVVSAIGASFAFETGLAPAHQVNDVAVESCRSGVGALQGNLATFEANVAAHGENSFVDLQADAVALEDQYSSSVVSATSAIDIQVVYTEYVGTRWDDTIVTDNGDSLVRGGRGDDVIRAGNGDDWLFGGKGDDRISGGGGNDTAFGGDGRDHLNGGDGDDWLFGGDGKDSLSGDAGNDLIVGGDGNDLITGGSGNDLLDGGDGRDDISGGAGNDVFRLGFASGDGDDLMRGGEGADTYLVAGAFDDDTIADFSVSGGDRLAIEGLDALIGAGSRAISMERDRGDRDDLVVTLRLGGERSTLTLDEFFANNPEFGAMPMRGAFSTQQTAAIMHAIAVDADTGPAMTDTQLTFQLGDLLAVFG